jgi:hypothetical protein
MYYTRYYHSISSFFVPKSRSIGVHILAARGVQGVGEEDEERTGGEEDQPQEDTDPVQHKNISTADTRQYMIDGRQ